MASRNSHLARFSPNFGTAVPRLGSVKGAKVAVETPPILIAKPNIMKANEPQTQTSRYRSLLAMVLVALPLLFSNAIAQAQPTITGIYPNGTNLFQSSAQLTFNASSAASITNVNVQLTITPISTGAPYLLGFTPGHGLTISGPATAESVSAPLQTNRVYAATIQVTDGNGATTTTNFNFDTVLPAYTFEAEDWDYTSGSGTGQYIDNPQVNQYAGLASTGGTDYNNANAGSGNSNYRPQGIETEGCGDTPRLAYIGTTNHDYDIGFGHTNTWGNYTRHYPAGAYNIFMRGADGNGQDGDSARVSVVSGTATIAGTGPYTFSVPNVGGWQTYSYVPARDSSGKLAVITFDGTPSTLQVFEDGGDMNANFYMLVLNDTNAPVIATVITNIYPDGSVQFQPAPALTFTTTSSNGIDPSGILVRLSGTTLLGVSFVSNLTATAGLTVGGTATNRTVSAPLLTNTAYTAFIQVVDGSGNPISATVTFDTVNPSYTFEGEDWDYNGGTFVDNPQTNAYHGVASVNTIDDLVGSGNAHSFAYRGGTLLGFGLNTEPNGDKPRAAYVSGIINPVTGAPYQDYDVGWNSGGDWGDYTRTYPAGKWNVYLRGANGGVNGPNGQGSGQAFLASVTSGVGSTNQTTTQLGTFTIRPTGGWQQYVFVPLLDAGGNLVQVTTTGGQQTFRVTTGGQATGGSYNANYYMFIPAQVEPLTIQNLYPDGTALFQYTNQLSFNVVSGTAVNTNGISVTLDGASAPLTITGSAENWHVICRVAANAGHTAVIAVTDTLGDQKNVTVKFDTFQATDYTWEAEDYDWTSNGISGQYFDNPQVDAYFDLPSAAGIDNQQSDANANPFLYRNVDTAGTLGPAPSTTAAGDLARAQFTGTNTDYNIGFFGNGSWCNYTRHYPAGTYYVWERYAEGGSGTTASTLSLVTGGYGTASQTTTLLGSFVDPVESWSIYRWAPLVDASNNWVKVTFNGSRQTLQLGGTLNGTQPEVNVNFLLLAPVPTAPMLNATISGRNVQLSFPTQVGNNYSVLWNSTLTGGTWQTLPGSSVAGNGSTMSVSDPVGAGTRFYRLEVQ